MVLGIQFLRTTWIRNIGASAETQIVTQIGTATDWKAISAGYFCSFAQKTDNTIWSWGINTGGVLGYGYSGGSLPTPAQAGITTNVKTFDTGENHTMYLKNDDSMWVGGPDQLGQLGVGISLSSQSIPTAIACPTSLGINDFVANEVAIYSNPTNGIITISSQDNLAIDKIEIVNILGKTVVAKTENTSRIDISNLANGIYVFKLYSGENVYQKKIIKQ